MANLNIGTLIGITVVILILGVVAMVSEKINTDISAQINTTEATAIKDSVHSAFTNITDNLGLITLVLVFAIVISVIMVFRVFGGGTAL